jgi:hypothetical protein
MTFSRGFPGCVVVFTSAFSTTSLLVVFFYENKWGSQHKFEILYHPRRRASLDPKLLFGHVNRYVALVLVPK